jgi:hypothetical protein
MRQAESLKIRIGIINFVAIQLLVKSTETIAQTNGDNILHIQPVFVSIIVKTYFRYEPFVVKLSRSSSVVLFSFPISAAKKFFCQPIITHKFDSFIALVIQSSCQFKQINTYAQSVAICFTGTIVFLFHQVHLLSLNLRCQEV